MTASDRRSLSIKAPRWCLSEDESCQISYCAAELTQPDHTEV